MVDMVSIEREELASLNLRLRNMAMDKANYQLVIHMIDELTNVAGLENMVNSILRSIHVVIGGSPITIYYYVDNELHATDTLGNKYILDPLEDQIVKEVFKTKTYVEHKQKNKDTFMLIEQFLNSYVWAFPLIAFNEIIGVVKVEGMYLNPEETKQFLQVFINFSSLLLRLEILGYSNLKKANEKLKEMNDQLNVLNVQLKDEIEDRIHYEELLMHAKDEAESANKAKSNFLANMSHEIRTPMNGIIGMIQLTLLNDLDPETKECLELAHLSANSLVRIINDILDYSKIEAGKIDLVDSEFKIRDMINEISTLFSVTINQKNIKMKCHIDYDVPELLTGDEIRLKQVLINLMGNAIKFTDEGSITIHIEKVEEISEQYTLRFTITDTGIGIPADKMEKLFVPFSQIDSSSTKNYKGTGLGLVISKKLINLMGGNINVESSAGKGSIFTFTVVLKKSTSVKNELITNTPVPLSDELSKSKILVVEDDYLNRLLVIKTLKSRYEEIDLAENGDEAIKKILENDYDLVLMDISMPVMDGCTATKVIREKEAEKGKHTIIIALTANALKGDREACIEEGMDDYISKPFDVSELRSLVDKWLKKPKHL